MKKVNLMVMLIFLAFSSFAAFLENVPTKLIQPNGKVINCFITGDEFYRCVHDSMGYTIVKNPQTQYFVYALPMEDTITHSNYVVGVADPIALGLKKWVTISSEKISATLPRKMQAVYSSIFSVFVNLLSPIKDDAETPKPIYSPLFQ